MKKYLSFLLAAVLVFGLCACGTGSSTSESTASVPSAESAVPVADEAPEPAANEPGPQIEASAADDGDAAVEEVPEDDDFLPLCEETGSLQIWLPSNPVAGAFLEDGLNSHVMYQEAEKLTNVDIDWLSPNVFAADENFQLMIAANDLPDIIYEFCTRYNGGAAGMDDDLIVDVTPFLDEGLTPHYKAILESNEEYMRGVQELDGRIAGFATLAEDKLSIYGGLLVRQDWLDKLGLEQPETYDELHDVLAEMKSGLGLSDGPLWLPADGNPNYNNLVQGFGTIAKSAADGSIPLFVEDGVVKYGTYEDAYKDYISLMAQWYAEGLIYSDFVTELDPHGVSSELAATGRVGVFEGGQGFITSFKAAAEDPDYSITPMADIVKNPGDTTHNLKTGDLYGGNGMSITTQCEDMDLAAKWCDFWYSDIGYYLINYGVEGVSYTKNEDGTIQWTELMTDNPYGMELESATALYCTFSHPGVMDPHRTYSAFNDVQLSCNDVWSSRSDDAWKYPAGSVKLTPDETAQYNQRIADILTYSKEMTLKWIIGDEDIDTTWDTYKAQMKQMGIEEVIGIYQTAYDRYEA